MQTTNVVDSETFTIYFTPLPGDLQKSERIGPKGGPAYRFVGSAEIVDSQGEVIDIDAFKKVMPIMLEQGARINGFHTTLPAGEFFDWDFFIHKEAQVPAMWLDVEFYTAWPSQREIIRRVRLPPEDKEAIRGISVGGKRLKKFRECNQNICYVRTTDIEGWEWSVVRNGANPLALKLTEELAMTVEKSLLKSEKANKQPRSKKGIFTKDDTPCPDKKFCSHCGASIIKMDEEKKKYPEEEGEEKPEMEGEEVSEEPTEEGEPEGEFEADGEGEIPPEEEKKMEGETSEEYPDEEMPSDGEEMPSTEGGNGMSELEEKINYLTMQVDKLMTSLNIEKEAVPEVPEEYTDKAGNIYSLNKRADEKEKAEGDIVKGLEAKIAELSEQLSQRTIQPDAAEIAKHDDSLKKDNIPEADLVKNMDIEERFRMSNQVAKWASGGRNQIQRFHLQ